MPAHRVKKTCNETLPRDKMGAQTPAAGSNSAPYRSPDSFLYPSREVDSLTSSSGPGRPREMSVENRPQEQHTRQRRRCPNAKTQPSNIQEWLADQLPDGDLGDAFLEADPAPLVTKQSLSELDIQNIITNPKLRHDVNFDRDLSFRPNVDGPKGQQKQRQSQQYSMALVAELQLYNILFQGTERLACPWDRSVVAEHAKRRIPKMFKTVHEILKSLVPEQDHVRVDEHLDVPKLMQEIERGVCDLVSLAEWMACLLKEHCAPMRDCLVNEMVDTIRRGVAENSLERIVCGIQKLFGILEAMKLDIANHQIRNLKTLLIEDTAKFENHYHLDRLIRGKARVDRDAAQKWWARASFETRPHCISTAQSTPRSELELFTRVVVSTLFTRAGQPSFPDTFYLDQDRLRALKTEIDDLIYLEICFAMFDRLLPDFGYTSQAPVAAKRDLRDKITAFTTGNSSFGAHLWHHHAGPISLEICRQAALVAGRSPASNLDLDYQQRATDHLLSQFDKAFPAHAAALEAALLQPVLACTSKHFASSPSDLFYRLVLPSPPPPPPHAFVPAPPRDSAAAPPLHAEKIADLTNRISHIALLHWRIWGPIAYVLDDAPAAAQACSQPIALSASSPSPAPPHPVANPAPAPQSKGGEAHCVDVGVPPDVGDGGTAAP